MGLAGGPTGGGRLPVRVLVVRELVTVGIAMAGLRVLSAAGA